MKSCCSPIVLWEGSRLRKSLTENTNYIFWKQNSASESRIRRSENHLQEAELDAKHKTDNMCAGELQNCYEPVTAMS